MSVDLFILAAEKSGDVHGAHLLQNLFKENSALHVVGIAGEQMRKTPMHCLIPAERFETMGFIDIIPALPRLIKLLYRVKKLILEHNPKRVLLIDYAEFNLRLARLLRKSGYEGKIEQYICPSVWAWRKGRIKTMVKYLDHVYCILPFEPDFFKNTPLQATYITNPLVTEHANATHDPAWKQKFPRPVLAIFPGSRSKEIKRNLPIQLRAAHALSEKHGLQPVISCAHAKFLRLILKINRWDFPIVDVRHTHNLMHHAQYAIATSGTVNLQLALYGVPTVVNFAIRPIDQFIAQKILRINLPHYSLPNIIAKQRIFPELYGNRLSVNALIDNMDQVIRDEDQQNTISSLCAQIHKTLKQKNSVNAK